MLRARIRPAFSPALSLVTLVLGLVVLFVACMRDTTAPQVSIISPADNAIRLGNIGIQARASDNKAVTAVEFYVDDILTGTDSLSDDSLYDWTWDASSQALGTLHQLKAKAFDAAGNSAEAEVSITIGIPAGPAYHSGNITQPETWYPGSNPHIVNGNLTIGAFVTLKPGVVVKVDDGLWVKVGSLGGLLARGRSNLDSGITFTSNSASPQPGSWKGIEVTSQARSDSVDLQYCVIEYGGDSLDANLDVRSGPITVKYCDIRHGGGYGVRVQLNGLNEFAANYVTANRGYGLKIDSRYVGRLANDNDLSGNTKGGAEVIGGTVPASAQWPDLNAPYVINATLNVGHTGGAVLTLNSVQLRFRPGTGLVVGGADSTVLGGLVANGTTFTSDSATPNPGDWSGVAFGRTTIADSATLAGCVIEYGGGNGKGSVYSDSCPLALTGTTIRNSAGYGVYIQKTGFRNFLGNAIGQCQQYPVHIEPEFVGTLGGSDLSNSPRSGAYIPDGRVLTSATWVNGSYPYVVAGTVDVSSPAHPVLTLVPGDTLLFVAPSARLRIGPNIYSAVDSGGLAADGVAFTGTSPLPGSWRGLQLQNNTLTSSFLRNSSVTYAGADTFGPGNLLVQGCAPEITGNEFAYSSHWGIYLYNSLLEADTLRAHNTFHDNADGDINPQRAD
jgi:hypothetical protein